MYSIIVECYEWLREKKVDQWRHPYPLHRFEQEIAEEEVYYLEENGNKVATFTLLRKKPDYYPEGLWRDDETRAAYLCRLAVKRAYKGLNYGRKCLELVEEKCRNEGIEEIRLDCTKTNPFLENYYRKSGFEKVGECRIEDAIGVLMRKKIA